MTAVYERTSAFLEGERRNRRQIVTPEGVPLPVEVADFGERITAFLIDLLFWFLATVAIFLVFLLLLFGGIRVEVGASITLFLAFVVRCFYFMHFELAWQGATPGKRIVGLRVIDRRGGPLLPGAVVARNLTREIECFLPASLLISLAFAGGAASWESLSLGAWLLLLSALPFFNRDRMRAGDLIAGTMVIALPRRALLDDLVRAESSYQFTPKQLAAYGGFELQVLEELLRGRATPGSVELRREVLAKICRRIGWTEPVPAGETDRFLEAFYTAERAYLEREQLFGKLHLDKHRQEKAGG